MDEPPLKWPVLGRLRRVVNSTYCYCFTWCNLGLWSDPRCYVFAQQMLLCLYTRLPILFRQLKQLQWRPHMRP